MVRLDNYSAWVSVDGNPLQEYETTTEGSVVTCWISSEVGKNFEVNWEFFGVDGYHTADVRLDGQFARSRSANGRNWKSSAAGVLVTQASERLFMFSRLELTDDDVYLTETNAQLGEIKVELHESLNICPTSFKNQSRFSEPGKVHERSKKAIGHQIGLGQEKRCKTQHITKIRRLRLLATFVFRYRPIDILRANGLAPPVPSQSLGQKRRITDDDDMIDLTLEDSDGELSRDTTEEIAALEARLAMLRNQNQNKRQKLGVKAEVKSEPDIKHEPRERVQLGVIDLT
ncbi:hypothetical protein VKT23_015838 [Stygiomarasmius scandens]|uniref:DUF7918 domain-containing protein n=1 Tax=Marasmiellus scandens TaxID=2682957 RepID=A0ABR1J166_9AGAR